MPFTPFPFLQGHSDSVICIHYDEPNVFSGSQDHTIKVWDVGTSLLLVRTLTRHNDDILSIATHRRLLVSTSADHSMVFWDRKTFACLLQFQVNHLQLQVVIPSSNSYSTILTSSTQGVISCWRIDPEITQYLELESLCLFSFSFFIFFSSYLLFSSLIFV